MDFLNVLVANASMTPVATVQNGGLQGSNGANFQNQLTFYVAQNGSQASSSQLEQTAETAAIMPVGIVTAIPDEQWTSEELQTMIDHLLDSLNSLQEQALDHEQMELLLPVMEQLAALLQLMGVPQNDAAVQVLQPVDLQALPAKEQQIQLITKLQDQLLLLQQNVEQGSIKLLQGKQPEAIIGQQLQKFSLAVNELEQQLNKTNPNNQTGANPFFVEQGKTSADAAVHLQRMSDEANFKFVTRSSSETASQPIVSEQTQSQSTEFSLVRADHGKDFTPVLSRTATPTTYVMAEKFAETIKGMIVQKFTVNNLNGVTEAKLQLTPEHLGQVDVKISMHNGIMTAIFQAETAMGKDALENQMAQLRASLAAQGITVEKIEVAQASFAAQLNQQQKQQQQFANGQNKEKQEQQDIEFEDELIGNASIRELGYGRSVNEVV